MRRGEIEDLSRKVNALLGFYVQVHNGIYHRSWWRGLFKPIPFGTYEVDISAIEGELKHCERTAAALRDGATHFELQHLTILHEYVVALLEAVTLLRRIIVALKAKSDGQPYKLREYMLTAPPIRQQRRRTSRSVVG
jgi:hypothetical protein